MMAKFTKEQLITEVSAALVSAKEDAELLKQCPHAFVNGTDLALVAKVQNAEGKTFFITNDQKGQTHLTEAEIMRAATQNLIQRKDYIIAPINQLLGLPEDPDALKMLVVTNRSGQYGAAEVFNPKVQQELSTQLGGDFYIIPSSKHEIIAVSASSCIGQKELKSMVMDINASEVSQSDKLSDNVYRYDFQTKKLEIASEMKNDWVKQGDEVRGRRR